MPPQDVFADSMSGRSENRSVARNIVCHGSIWHIAKNIWSYPFSRSRPLCAPCRRSSSAALPSCKDRQCAGGNMPSLHIDLHNGRSRSEISWLNGAVEKKGESVNVRTPVNQMFTEVLSGLVGSEEKQSLWNRGQCATHCDSRRVPGGKQRPT